MDTDNRRVKAWNGRGQWNGGAGRGGGKGWWLLDQDKGPGSKTEVVNVSTKAGKTNYGAVPTSCFQRGSAKIHRNIYESETLSLPLTATKSCQLYPFPIQPVILENCRQGKRKSGRLKIQPKEPEHLPKRIAKFYCTRCIGLHQKLDTACFSHAIGLWRRSDEW